MKSVKNIDIKSKNSGVELARIIACLCVICIHVGITNRDEFGYIGYRLLSSCFVADGVAVFWLITGFFLIDTTYKKIVKRTIRKIGIPMIVCYIFSFYFADIIITGTPWIDSVRKTWIDYEYQIKQFLNFEASIPFCGHYWYLYAYFLLILCFPIIKCFLEYLDQNIHRMKIFLTIVVVMLIWNDFTANTFLAFSHHSINALIPAVLIICLGHCIYRFKHILVRRNLWIVYLFLFCIVNVCRTYIIIISEDFGISYYILIYWFSLSGIICASCIVLGCMSLMDQISNFGVNRIVCNLGNETFGIYLIHFLVMEFIKSRLIFEYITQICNQVKSESIGYICYLVIMSITIFLVSFVIIICIRKIIGKIQHLFKALNLGRWK